MARWMVSSPAAVMDLERIRITHVPVFPLQSGYGLMSGIRGVGWCATVQSLRIWMACPCGLPTWEIWIAMAILTYLLLLESQPSAPLAAWLTWFF